MLRDRLTRPFRAVRRAVLVRRRLLAALLTAVAVAAGLQAAAAPPPPSVRVLTAARDLPAGTRARRRRPGRAASSRPTPSPPGWPTTRSAAPWPRRLRRGEPVTDVRLVGAGAHRAAVPTCTALPVRLPDAAMVDLLEVGDVIDLVATDPQGGGRDAWSRPACRCSRSRRPTTDAGGDGQPGALVVVGASRRPT